MQSAFRSGSFQNSSLRTPARYASVASANWFLYSSHRSPQYPAVLESKLVRFSVEHVYHCIISGSMPSDHSVPAIALLDPPFGFAGFAVVQVVL